MKLLLDENLPRKLKKDLAGHEAFTVRDMLWDGKENGELLALYLTLRTTLTIRSGFLFQKFKRVLSLGFRQDQS
jgi:hypothetical protein